MTAVLLMGLRLACCPRDKGGWVARSSVRCQAAKSNIGIAGSETFAVGYNMSEN